MKPQLAQKEIGSIKTEDISLLPPSYPESTPSRSLIGNSFHITISRYLRLLLLAVFTLITSKATTALGEERSYSVQNGAELLITKNNSSLSTQSLLHTTKLADQISAITKNSSEVASHYRNLSTVAITKDPNNFSVASYSSNFRRVTQSELDYECIKFKAIGLRCEPNVEVSVADKNPNDPAFSGASPFNDKPDSQLWGLQKIKAPAAWDITTGSANIKIALLDSGIDYGHPDLSNSIGLNASEVNGRAGQDDDNNGFIDDKMGINLVDGAISTVDPADDFGHGTHVAGTIAAHTNNELGISGTSWESKLIPIKVVNSQGSGSAASVVQGIYYAIDRGAAIINISLGTEERIGALEEAIGFAYNAGVVIVAAAGNSGLNNNLRPFYPASYVIDNIISVAASDRNDNLAIFSNYGSRSVDIAAPGQGIMSTMARSIKTLGYQGLSGTSMAAPHVSGVAALMLAKNPLIPLADIRNIINSTADRPEALNGKLISNGRLNAFEALKMADGLSVPSTATPTSTPTNTPVNTNTPTETPTITPSNTPQNTPTQTPTRTPTNTDTPTASPTNTYTATATFTPTDTPVNTNTPTETPTITPTNTPQNTPTQTPTHTPTNTDTPTASPTNTYTATATFTPTDTPVNTDTPKDTPQDTPTQTPTHTPTIIPSDTPTPTPTDTETFTPTPLNTDTPLPTASATPSPSPTSTQTSTPPPAAIENDRELTIFTTRERFPANFGGRIKGQELCTNAAKAGGLRGIWHPIIADLTTDPRDITGYSEESAPVYNSAGRKIAENRRALWFNTLLDIPGFDEFGVAKEQLSAAFTGSGPHGIRSQELNSSQSEKFCDSWSSNSETLKVTSGNSSATDTTWYQDSSIGCNQSLSLYCVGERADTIPLSTPTYTSTVTPTHSQTPTLTPTYTETPTDTPTSQPTDTPISIPPMPSDTYTSTPTISPSPTATYTSKPTLPPTVIPSINPTKPGNNDTISIPKSPDITTSPTPLPATTNIALPPGIIAGDGGALTHSLVYAPQAVRVTIADQKGFFSFKKPFKIPSKVLIQVRKVGLPNGGFNILAEPGNYISTLQNATLLNYNTQRCRERDSFESLFQGANRITSFFEYLQGELAALREILIAQGIPRAVRDNESRIQIHAENYYRLSASLPDIQLLCAKDQSNCSKVVFSQERRKLLHSVRELRSEALLLNRVIRTNGRRNEASSRKRVAQIIRRSNRIRTIVNSLPRFSFSCS